DGCGGALQLDRALVVTESLPRLDHVNRRRARKLLDCREPFQELDVRRYHARRLRLLEHHFGDERWIRIAMLAPRKCAAVLVEPRQRALLHLADVGARGHHARILRVTARAKQSKIRRSYIFSSHRRPWLGKQSGAEALHRSGG